MDFEIDTYKGVGDITFDMTAEEVRKILGKPDFSGKQNRFSDGEMDAFSSKGITVHYTEDKTVAMVEFSGPEFPTYEGENLLEVTDPEVWLDEKDEDAEIMPPDYMSKKLGISFYKPPVGLHSVAAFEEGYYNAL